MAGPGLAALGVVGCADGRSAPGSSAPAGPPTGPPPGSPVGAPSTAAPQQAESARVGRQGVGRAPSFTPQTLTLPGGERAPVVPVATVDGELAVPTDVDRLGWWDGSARVGDAFGSVVIAGHVDSATDGLGFFARLLDLRVGQVVEVTGDGLTGRFRIASARRVDRDALSADGEALDQTGEPRLVLITCTGAYVRDRGGYQQNLVVTGVPVTR